MHISTKYVLQMPKHNSSRHVVVIDRDCNPGLEFSIPGFGIVEFPIPRSRDPVGIGGL